jgi:hypothetical protein
MVTTVPAAHTATRNDQIAFGNRVFDRNIEIGESASKLGMKIAKAFNAVHRIARAIDESVNHHFVGQQFIDHFTSALVPNFFEPSLDQSLVSL